MKKAKYGSRSKSRSKPQQSNLQFLKDGDQDIYSDVLDTLPQDFIKYISDMVKVSKTSPNQKRKHDYQQSRTNRINQLFSQESSQKHQQQVIYYAKQDPIVQLSKATTLNSKQQQQIADEKVLQTAADIKNQTKRFKNRQLLETNKMPSTFMKLGRKDKQKLSIRNSILQKYDRKITEPCDKQRASDTSIIMKNSIQDKNLYQTSECGPKFIATLNEYLTKLQKQTCVPSKKGLSRQKYSNKQKGHNITNQQPHLDYQKLFIQNIRLKKKLRQYEEKVIDLQDSVKYHLDYCKSRDKNNKQKVKELVKALAQALTKINNQKEQLEMMKGLFKNFGRKVQQYSRYQEHSSVELQQQINNSLKKMLRPTRAKSQNKVKKHKRNLDSTLRRLQQDRFIDR